jgi:gliding motility-associated-like protein
MKNFLSFLFFVFTATGTYGQVVVCLGDDDTICSGTSVTINQCASGTASIINYLNSAQTAILLPAPTITPLTDDVFSAVQNIGFPFTFFGTTYNQFVISSNGYISFNTAQANGGSPWSITASIPSPANPLNAIYAGWTDLNPGIAGTVGFQTIGTAPNRQLVVFWQNVAMFGCNTLQSTQTLTLYESTNVISTGIRCANPCVTWNNGSKIQGIQNIDGTIGYCPPGYNFGSAWAGALINCTYTPTGLTTYVMDPNATFVTYVIPTAVVWQNTLGQPLVTQPNGSLNISAGSVPNGTTGYFQSYSNQPGTCGVPGATVALTSDTTFITKITVNGSISNTPDICSSNVGTATVVPTSGIAPFTYLWTPSGQTSATTTGFGVGIKTCLITDANGCTKTLTTTILDNPVNVTAVQSQIVNCPGGSNGAALATLTPVIAGTAFNWYDAGGQTTNPAIGLSAGLYHVAILTPSGCRDTAAVTITEISGMSVTQGNVTAVTCNSGADGIAGVTVTAGTAPYTYSWDRTTQTTNPANTLPAGPNIITITDVNGCVKTLSINLNEPAPLVVSSVSPPQIICVGADVTLEGTGSGGSSPYIYTWTLNGAVVGTSDSITIPTTVSNASYCLILTEQCGSPGDTLCADVVWPAHIAPTIMTTNQVAPYGAGACTPSEITFWNTNPSNKISTIAWDFGNQHNAIAGANDSLTDTYLNPGTYDISLVITSVYGCVYDSSYVAYVKAYANPVADFGMNSSPTTIFETDIKFTEAASSDVVDWEWKFVGGLPATSQLEVVPVTFPIGVIANYPVQLIVTNSNGCKDSISKEAIVNNDVLLFAPNTFTPDGDEFNQTWKITLAGIDVTDFNIIMLNRWGQTIWESNDPKAEWDGTFNGKIVELGVYQWKAEYKDLNTDRRYRNVGGVNIIK